VNQAKHNQATDQSKIHMESMALSQSSNGVIPYIEGEILSLEEEIKAFRLGLRLDTEFMPFRLRQGVYGQRQPDGQMVRVKVPGGILTPGALEVLGRAAELYTPLKKGHVTTRENIQFHHVKLEDTPEFLRLLGTEGLSTREACGNTVRNVIGSPVAGVCHDEVFDPTPYLVAYVRYAVRHSVTQNFPRKFKTSFTGCLDHNTVVPAIHDLSFIAKLKQHNGVQTKGFTVIVGGGTSIMPRLGKVLYDFVSGDDYLRVAEAVWRVFDKSELLRKNRMMARIKVLIDRIGFDPFKELVEAELKQIGDIDPYPLMSVEDLAKEIPPPILDSDIDNTDPSHEFDYWKNTNTVEQKQEGYYIVYIKLPLGDVYFTQFAALANIVRQYTGGQARSTQEQNIALRWVPKHSLHDVWEELKAIGLVDAEAHTITDVVSCPGTDSCKLGITSSMGLGRAIKDELTKWNGLLEDPLIRKMRVKMSGCPNGCGLHHIASIGFHGAAMKGPGGVQVPAYELFVGGTYDGNGIEGTKFGQRVAGVKVPSKRVPELIRSLAIYYSENRESGEEFPKFIERVGTEGIKDIANKSREIDPLSDETRNIYTDWDKSDLYKVERGEGECMV